MKKKTAKIKKIAPSAPFRITILANGRTYAAKGKTILAALTALKLDHLKTKAILTVKRGTVKYERLINPLHVRRMFGGGSPTTKTVLMMQLEKFLSSAFV